MMKIKIRKYNNQKRYKKRDIRICTNVPQKHYFIIKSVWREKGGTSI